MTQCYDMHESVSTYTNYNHYESTILELSHFKKSVDYENGTRRYRCLDCGKAFSPLTGTLFDANKIPISEWIEYMIHLFEFHSLSSSAIKEDMDFLNDIDKESLTDAPDTRIFTSMSYKLEYKKNHIMFSAIPSLIEKIIYLALFIISIFISWSLLYSAIKDLDHNLGILKSLGCSKGGIIKIVFCLFFVLSVLELAITIFSILAFDLFVDYFYLGFSILRIKADYLLIIILLILSLGFISSIASSYKALRGNPTNVINSH